MENLRTRAYTEIKKKIINCTYAPGSFLDSIYLAQTLNMSRTPIREALTMLEHEGLVKIVSQKGIMIQNITLKNVRDVYATREIIEPQMILCYGKDIPAETLEECRSRLSVDICQLPLEEIVELDDLLHKIIMHASDNSYIIMLFQSLCDQNRRIQYITRSLTERREKNQSKHIEILDCMLRGEFDRASDLMRGHLKESREDAFRDLMNR